MKRPLPTYFNLDLQIGVYAGTSPSGLILKSIDNGLTFTNMGNVGHGNPTCFCQLTNGDLLYGTDTGYVVNYTQGTSVSVSVHGIRDIAYGYNGEVWVAYCEDDNGFFRSSSDNGGSWSYVFNGWLVNKIIITGTNYLLFSVSGVGVNGPNLVQAGNFTCAMDAGSGVLYAGDTSGHVWKSINYGAGWADLGDQTGSSNQINTIIPANNGRIIIAVGDSIYYTDDNFVTISSYIKIVVGDDIYPIILITGDILIAGDNGGGIWRSIDNGLNWSGISGNPQQGETSINCLINIT